MKPLSVSVQSSGKKRLILDLRLINKHLWKQRVKFEDLKVALNFLDAGHFMFSFDIKSGYHHVEISLLTSVFWGFPGITRVRFDIFASESFPLTFLQPLSSLLRFLGLSFPTGGDRVTSPRSPLSRSSVCL